MFSVLLPIIYISFISLGLPDSLLGCAWPTIYPQFGVPFSSAGIISMIISVGTVISSLMSDRLTARFGTGRVTAASVALTALALLGFSVSGSFWMLCALAVPYGLGAGSVDATLNNYVALHYASRHMSWLHCMWGLGASIGPYIMGYALAGGQGWSGGYRCIAILQAVLTVILIISLPLWKSRKRTAAENAKASVNGSQADVEAAKPLGIRGVIAIAGAKEILVMFFCYCAIESTAGLWASSYMALHSGVDKATAASWGSLFFVGITVGRALSGFMTMRFDDPTMIRIGQGVLLIGLLTMFLPLPNHLGVVAGLVIVGFGCAPIYPCVIHATPDYFGEDKSQAIVGVQMACAYAGSLLMPPMFGLIAQYVSISLYPFYMLAILVIMVLMHERLRRKVA